jgi:hypothetical protein
MIGWSNKARAALKGSIMLKKNDTPPTVITADLARVRRDITVLTIQVVAFLTVVFGGWAAFKLATGEATWIKDTAAAIDNQFKPPVAKKK